MPHQFISIERTMNFPKTCY